MVVYSDSSKRKIKPPQHASVLPVQPAKQLHVHLRVLAACRA
jgi:hypothetical protein